MNSGLKNLISTLKLETIEPALFKGRPMHPERPLLYGGQHLSQSLAAAYQTVEKNFTSISFHGYFLREGMADDPVDLRVSPLHDGKNTCMRRVTISQGDRSLFMAATAFQKPVNGLEHSASMPDVVGPEGIMSDYERYKRAIFGPDVTDAEFPEWPVDIRLIDPISFDKPEKKPTKTCAWLKAHGKLPADQALHQQIFAYAVDTPLLLTALRPHGVNPLYPTIQIMSLDHAMWFHRNFCIDQWLLMEMDSPNMGEGRAIAHGKVFDEKGVLVASVTQEGVARYRK